jgi:FkbM family methyltransferase
MKKQTKKFLSGLMPKGIFKDKLKCLYYNILSPGDVSFSVVSGNPVLYQTNYKGIKFITKDPLYVYGYEYGVYERFYTVKPGDVILDAGANTGYVSLLYSKRAGTGGKVFAFEPDAINIQQIKDNIALNGGCENIIIEDLLLWNENTFVEFYESGTVGSSALWIPTGVTTVKKQTITIDDWVKQNNITKLDFVKMNIEGAEIEALEGCVETIKNLKPDFAIYSNHLVNGELTYIRLEAFFKKIGYPYRTLRKNNEIVTYAGKHVK